MTMLHDQGAVYRMMAINALGDLSALMRRTPEGAICSAATMPSTDDGDHRLTMAALWAAARSGDVEGGALLLDTMGEVDALGLVVRDLCAAHEHVAEALARLA